MKYFPHLINSAFLFQTNLQFDLANSFKKYTHHGSHWTSLPMNKASKFQTRIQNLTLTLSSHIHKRRRVNSVFRIHFFASGRRHGRHGWRYGRFRRGTAISPGNDVSLFESLSCRTRTKIEPLPCPGTSGHLNCILFQAKSKIFRYIFGNFY